MPSSKFLRQLSVVTLFLVVSAWVAHVAYSYEKDAHAREFRYQAESLAGHIQTQMKRFFVAIDGIRGLASTHPDLSAYEFRNYLYNADLFGQFPAVRAVAYAPRIGVDDLPLLIKRLARDPERQYLRYPTFTVAPEGLRQEYFPATLVEPRAGNDKVYGFDLWALPTRRHAAERARDSGRPIMSAPVVLSQDADSDIKSVLLLNPVYAAGMPTQTLQERRDAHIGFIPAGFTISYALQQILTQESQQILPFSLYDAGSTELAQPNPLAAADLLYSTVTAPADHSTHDQPPQEASVTFTVGGRYWHLITARPLVLTWMEQYATAVLIVLLGLALGAGAARLLEDILASRDTRKRLQFAESEVDAFFDMSVDMFCVVSFDGYFKQINRAWVSGLKFDQEYLLQTPLKELIHPDDLLSSQQVMHRLQQGETITDFRNRYRTRSGEYRWLSWRGTAAPGDRLIFAVARDVTTKMANEKRIQKLAYFDPLTELANRSNFMDQLHREISLARRQHNRLAIFYIDLDGFKDVNDSMGHETGDVLLQQVAERLRLELRSSDFAARLGGDEFCILINDLSGDYSAPAAAQRILQEISSPVDLGIRTVTPRASIGIAYFPEDGEDSTSLLRAADSAMYSAKFAGKHRYACYQPHMTEAAMERLQMEQELRYAIEHNQLELHYQPQICLQTGTLKGVEALVRWRHPEKGLIMPLQFIETAERLRIIDALGEWVLNTACTQAQRWSQSGRERFTIAVNISPLHFEDPELLPTVRNALLRSGLPPEYLELEITETRILQTQAGQANASALRRMGVHVAVDDFGTGYSSLQLLQQLEIDTIKIDRSFITPLAEQPEAAILLGTIVGAAHAFGAKVVAEGVETLEQARILHGVGCNLVQGYYFCHPVPALELPSGDQSLYPKESAVDTAEKGIHII
ncbi:EAL domain-containing protein [Pontibacterium granulatum]|uniref:bifunctional diguanylate cyclase/phosphodiesterase n=1 Tax=Pontibacterium granulatum TaxID=2036029 RepID=UPI00249C9241|nr:EAL domain-containing protein [Pontibacterium granulatum]MDI3325705.1 EAL domain-containing protein [Pontibacterium granulatum]